MKIKGMACLAGFVPVLIFCEPMVAARSMAQLSHGSYLAVSVQAEANSSNAAILAQQHGERGREFAKQGDLESATSEFREAVHLAPQNPTYLTDLGIVLAQQQRFEEAIRYLQKAVTADSGNIALRRSLAAAQWQAGMLVPARQNLELILKAKPRDPAASLLLGMVLENSGDYAGAARLLAPVISLSQSHPESIAALLRCYYKTRQLAQAHSMENELLKDSIAAATVLRCVRVAMEAEDYLSAGNMLQALHQAYGPNPDIDYELAFLRYQTGHYPEAEAVLKNLTEASATPKQLDLLAWCFAKQGRTSEAVKMFHQAIDLAPQQASIYADLAAVLAEDGHLSDALEAANGAVRVDPNSYAAFRAIGMIQTRQHNYTAAVDSYTRAAQLNPASSDALVDLADAQASAGLFTESSSTFEQAIRKYPRDPQPYYQYALVILHHGDPSQTRKQPLALSMLEKALLLDQSLSDAHYQLATIWLARDENLKALAQLQDAAKQDNNNKNIHYSLSLTYRKLGRAKEAESELQIFKNLEAQEKPQ